jgi:hypothetical protein
MAADRIFTGGTLGHAFVTAHGITGFAAVGAIGTEIDFTPRTGLEAAVTQAGGTALAPTQVLLSDTVTAFRTGGGEPLREGLIGG